MTAAAPPSPARRALLALPLAALLGGCASRRKPRSSTGGGSSTPTSTASLKLNPRHREASVAQAMLLLGAPYRYGGASPASGFDCSGLVHYIYSQLLSPAERARLPRSAAQWAAASRPVAENRLQRGDLVFFNTSTRAHYSHMGIYIGSGQFIHAPSTGKTVRKESLSSSYYKKRYLGARSVFAD